MEKTGVQRLGGVLKVLLTIVFVCNLLVLPLVPMLVNTMSQGADSMGILAERAIEALEFHSPVAILQKGAAIAVMSWVYLGEMHPYSLVLTGFLLFCGICTAVLIWQARRVLGQICKEAPFCRENATSMMRGAVCCFLIAGAALVRALWGVIFYQSIRPLLTYNALFCPIFLIAGLLCMVMSALFRQAADLREESDLTI